MTGRDKEILVEKALEARRFSYVPYSGFRVGAALLAKDGRIITGCPGLEPPRDFAPPCGVCRQVLVEFCDPDRFLVLLCKGDKTWKEFTLAELLPLGFSGKNLER